MSNLPAKSAGFFWMGSTDGVTSKTYSGSTGNPLPLIGVLGLLMMFVTLILGMAAAVTAVGSVGRVLTGGGRKTNKTLKPGKASVPASHQIVEVKAE